MGRRGGRAAVTSEGRWRERGGVHEKMVEHLGEGQGADAGEHFAAGVADGVQIAAMRVVEQGAREGNCLVGE